MNSNKEVSVPIRSLDIGNDNLNMLNELEKKHSYLNEMLCQMKAIPSNDQEKFLKVVQRVMDLEDELKMSGINVPKDDVLFEKVIMAMLKDYPNTDLQIVATSSRRITTTKMSYEEPTPGMDNKTDNEVMERQRKLLNEICEKDNEKDADGMSSQDNVQQSEKVDEGYTEDNGDITSKRMTHTIVTTQTTYVPEQQEFDKTPEKEADIGGSQSDEDNESVISQSVKNKVAKFENIMSREGRSVSEVSLSGTLLKDKDSVSIKSLEQYVEKLEMPEKDELREEENEIIESPLVETSSIASVQRLSAMFESGEIDKVKRSDSRKSDVADRKKELSEIEQERKVTKTIITKKKTRIGEDGEIYEEEYEVEEFSEEEPTTKIGELKDYEEEEVERLSPQITETKIMQPVDKTIVKDKDLDTEKLIEPTVTTMKEEISTTTEKIITDEDLHDELKSPELYIEKEYEPKVEEQEIPENIQIKIHEEKIPDIYGIEGIPVYKVETGTTTTLTYTEDKKPHVIVEEVADSVSTDSGSRDYGYNYDKEAYRVDDYRDYAADEQKIHQIESKEPEISEIRINEKDFVKTETTPTTTVTYVGERLPRHIPEEDRKTVDKETEEFLKNIEKEPYVKDEEPLIATSIREESEPEEEELTVIQKEVIEPAPDAIGHETKIVETTTIIKKTILDKDGEPISTIDATYEEVEVPLHRLDMAGVDQKFADPNSGLLEQKMVSETIPAEEEPYYKDVASIETKIIKDEIGEPHYLVEEDVIQYDEKEKDEEPLIQKYEFTSQFPVDVKEDEKVFDEEKYIIETPFKELPLEKEELHVTPLEEEKISYESPIPEDKQKVVETVTTTTYYDEEGKPTETIVEEKQIIESPIKEKEFIHESPIESPIKEEIIVHESPIQELPVSEEDRHEIVETVTTTTYYDEEGKPTETIVEEKQIIGSPIIEKEYIHESPVESPIKEDIIVHESPIQELPVSEEDRHEIVETITTTTYYDEEGRPTETIVEEKQIIESPIKEEEFIHESPVESPIKEEIIVHESPIRESPILGEEFVHKSPVQELFVSEEHKPDIIKTITTTTHYDEEGKPTETIVEENEIIEPQIKEEKYVYELPVESSIDEEIITQATPIHESPIDEKESIPESQVQQEQLPTSPSPVKDKHDIEETIITATYYDDEGKPTETSVEEHKIYESPIEDKPYIHELPVESPVRDGVIMHESPIQELPIPGEEFINEPLVQESLVLEERKPEIVETITTTTYYDEEGRPTETIVEEKQIIESPVKEEEFIHESPVESPIKEEIIVHESPVKESPISEEHEHDIIQTITTTTYYDEEGKPTESIVEEKQIIESPIVEKELLHESPVKEEQLIQSPIEEEKTGLESPLLIEEEQKRVGDAKVEEERKFSSSPSMFDKEIDKKIKEEETPPSVRKQRASKIPISTSPIIGERRRISTPTEIPIDIRPRRGSGSISRPGSASHSRPSSGSLSRPGSASIQYSPRSVESPLKDRSISVESPVPEKLVDKEIISDIRTEAIVEKPFELPIDRKEDKKTLESPDLEIVTALPTSQDKHDVVESVVTKTTVFDDEGKPIETLIHEEIMKDDKAIHEEKLFDEYPEQKTEVIETLAKSMYLDEEKSPKETYIHGVIESSPTSTISQKEIITESPLPEDSKHEVLEKIATTTYYDDEGKQVFESPDIEKELIHESPIHEDKHEVIETITTTHYDEEGKPIETVVEEKPILESPTVEKEFIHESPVQEKQLLESPIHEVEHEIVETITTTHYDEEGKPIETVVEEKQILESPTFEKELIHESPIHEDKHEIIETITTTHYDEEGKPIETVVEEKQILGSPTIEKEFIHESPIYEDKHEAIETITTTHYDEEGKPIETVVEEKHILESPTVEKELIHESPIHEDKHEIIETITTTHYDEEGKPIETVVEEKHILGSPTIEKELIHESPVQEEQMHETPLEEKEIVHESLLDDYKYEIVETVPSKDFDGQVKPSESPLKEQKSTHESSLDEEKYEIIETPSSAQSYYDEEGKQSFVSPVVEQVPIEEEKIIHESPLREDKSDIIESITTTTYYDEEGRPSEQIDEGKQLPESPSTMRTLESPVYEEHKYEDVKPSAPSLYDDGQELLLDSLSRQKVSEEPLVYEFKTDEPYLETLDRDFESPIVEPEYPEFTQMEQKDIPESPEQEYEHISGSPVQEVPQSPLYKEEHDIVGTVTTTTTLYDDGGNIIEQRTASRVEEGYKPSERFFEYDKSSISGEETPKSSIESSIHEDDLNQKTVTTTVFYDDKGKIVGKSIETVDGSESHTEVVQPKSEYEVVQKVITTKTTFDDDGRIIEESTEIMEGYSAGEEEEGQIQQDKPSFDHLQDISKEETKYVHESPIKEHEVYEIHPTEEDSYIEEAKQGDIRVPESIKHDEEFMADQPIEEEILKVDEPQLHETEDSQKYEFISDFPVQEYEDEFATEKPKREVKTAASFMTGSEGFKPSTPSGSSYPSEYLFETRGRLGDYPRDSFLPSPPSDDAYDIEQRKVEDVDELKHDITPSLIKEKEISSDLVIHHQDLFAESSSIEHELHDYQPTSEKSLIEEPYPCDIQESETLFQEKDIKELTPPKHIIFDEIQHRPESPDYDEEYYIDSSSKYGTSGISETGATTITSYDDSGKSTEQIIDSDGEREPPRELLHFDECQQRPVSPDYEEDYYDEENLKDEFHDKEDIYHKEDKTSDLSKEGSQDEQYDSRDKLEKIPIYVPEQSIETSILDSEQLVDTPAYKLEHMSESPIKDEQYNIVETVITPSTYYGDANQQFEEPSQEASITDIVKDEPTFEVISHDLESNEFEQISGDYSESSNIIKENEPSIRSPISDDLGVEKETSPIPNIEGFTTSDQFKEEGRRSSDLFKESYIKTDVSFDESPTKVEHDISQFKELSVDEDIQEPDYILVSTPDNLKEAEEDLHQSPIVLDKEAEEISVSPREEHEFFAGHTIKDEIEEKLISPGEEKPVEVHLKHDRHGDDSFEDEFFAGKTISQLKSQQEDLEDKLQLGDAHLESDEESTMVQKIEPRDILEKLDDGSQSIIKETYDESPEEKSEEKKDVFEDEFFAGLTMKRDVLPEVVEQKPEDVEDVHDYHEETQKMIHTDDVQISPESHDVISRGYTPIKQEELPESPSKDIEDDDTHEEEFFSGISIKKDLDDKEPLQSIFDDEKLQIDDAFESSTEQFGRPESKLDESVHIAQSPVQDDQYDIVETITTTTTSYFDDSGKAIEQITESDVEGDLEESEKLLDTIQRPSEANIEEKLEEPTLFEQQVIHESPVHEDKSDIVEMITTTTYYDEEDKPSEKIIEEKQVIESPAKEKALLHESPVQEEKISHESPIYEDKHEVMETITTTHYDEEGKPIETVVEEKQILESPTFEKELIHESPIHEDKHEVIETITTTHYDEEGKPIETVVEEKQILESPTIEKEFIHESPVHEEQLLESPIHEDKHEIIETITTTHYDEEGKPIETVVEEKHIFGSPSLEKDFTYESPIQLEQSFASPIEEDKIIHESPISIKDEHEIVEEIAVLTHYDDENESVKKVDEKEEISHETPVEEKSGVMDVYPSSDVPSGVLTSFVEHSQGLILSPETSMSIVVEDIDKKDEYERYEQFAEQQSKDIVEAAITPMSIVSDKKDDVISTPPPDIEFKHFGSLTEPLLSSDQIKDTEAFNKFVEEESRNIIDDVLQSQYYELKPSEGTIEEIPKEESLMLVEEDKIKSLSTEEIQSLEQFADNESKLIFDQYFVESSSADLTTKILDEVVNELAERRKSFSEDQESLQSPQKLSGRRSSFADTISSKIDDAHLGEKPFIVDETLKAVNDITEELLTKLDDISKEESLIESEPMDKSIIKQEAEKVVDDIMTDINMESKILDEEDKKETVHLTSPTTIQQKSFDDVIVDSESVYEGFDQESIVKDISDKTFIPPVRPSTSQESEDDCKISQSFEFVESDDLPDYELSAPPRSIKLEHLEQSKEILKESPLDEIALLERRYSSVIGEEGVVESEDVDVKYDESDDKSREGKVHAPILADDRVYIIPERIEEEHEKKSSIFIVDSEEVSGESEEHIRSDYASPPPIEDVKERGILSDDSFENISASEDLKKEIPTSSSSENLEITEGYVASQEILHDEFKQDEQVEESKPVVSQQFEEEIPKEDESLFTVVQYTSSPLEEKVSIDHPEDPMSRSVYYKDSEENIYDKEEPKAPSSSTSSPNPFMTEEELKEHKQFFLTDSESMDDLHDSRDESKIEEDKIVYDKDDKEKVTEISIQYQPDIVSSERLLFEDDDDEDISKQPQLIELSDSEEEEKDRMKIDLSEDSIPTGSLSKSQSATTSTDVDSPQTVIDRFESLEKDFKDVVRDDKEKTPEKTSEDIMTQSVDSLNEQEITPSTDSGSHVVDNFIIDDKSLERRISSTSSEKNNHFSRPKTHQSYDNVSESSLQEFERLEAEICKKSGDVSPSSDESEGAKSRMSDDRAGSRNSLTEFERLEKELAEPSNDNNEVMMLSYIREESEYEDMSTKEDEENPDSLNDASSGQQRREEEEEDDSKDIMTESLIVADSLEQIPQIPSILETSVDSLEISNMYAIDDRNIEHQQPRRNDYDDEFDRQPFPTGETIIQARSIRGHDAIDNDSLLGFSSSNQTEDSNTNTSQNTEDTFQEYHEDDKDSLEGDLSHEGSDIPTTITTFKSTKVSPSGSTEIISRRVLTKVTDPVICRVKFTGTESEERLQSLDSNVRIETTDAEGNVTTTVKHQEQSQQ
uniref:Microtubule-associated protein futsch n=1 Tax=Parastrongyloides trichosuri TaxID=131310 RepID=A0A0N4ZBK6_PARTI